MTNDTIKRRKFLTIVGLGVVAVPAMRFTNLVDSSWISAASAAPKKVDPPAGMNPVAETDPIAVALGYKHDKKTVDAKKYPKVKDKTQFCNNCSFYTKSNEGWGKCQIIPTGVVNAQGWCNSWQKKA